MSWCQLGKYGKDIHFRPRMNQCGWRIWPLWEAASGSVCLDGLLRRTQDFPVCATGIFHRGGEARLCPGDYFVFQRDPLWCGAAGVLGAVAGVQVGERMGPELRQ